MARKEYAPGQHPGRVQGRRGMNDPSNILTHKKAACPSCGRACELGATWKGANYCRGLVLLQVINDNPGLSAWELSQISGVPYTDATRGLAKLREFKVVSTESEERLEGGIRYRYYPANDSVALDRFIATLHLVESRQ
jgi:hypothetical protein